LMCQTLLKSQK